MKAEHIREHKNFDAANQNVAKQIHAVDNEAARNIVDNLKINKNEMRDKKGNKVIKLPFENEENDKRESILIYRGLKDKYMTPQEILDEKKQRDLKVGKYLQSRRILKQLTRQTTIEDDWQDDGQSYNFSSDEQLENGEESSRRKEGGGFSQKASQEIKSTILRQMQDDSKLMLKFRKDPVLAVTAIHE